MLPTDLYTQDDIERQFGLATLRKGQQYVSRVSHLEVRPGVVRAEVAGTQPMPYVVDVQVEPPRKGRPVLRAFCSCPVAVRCKHAAATLLAALAWNERRRAGRVPAANPALLAWLDDFRRKATGERRTRRTAKRATHCLLYAVEWSDYLRMLVFAFHKARLTVGGEIAAADDRWNNVERALVQPPGFVDEEDLAILRMVWGLRSKRSWEACYPVEGAKGAAVLRQMVDSGRFFAGDPGGKPLHPGKPRPAAIEWVAQADGTLVPRIGMDLEAGFIAPTEPYWYFDTARGEAGEVNLPYRQEVVDALLAMPPATAEELPLVASAMEEFAPDLPRPSADALEPARVIDCDPVPVLVLDTLPVWGAGTDALRGGVRLFDHATLAFDYDGIRMEPADTREFTQGDDGGLVRIRRHREAEEGQLREALAAGLARADTRKVRAIAWRREPDVVLTLPDPGGWPAFVETVLPKLAEGGWRIEFSPDFRHRVVEPEEWVAELKEADGGWFDLDMGVVVEGQRLSLADLLSDLFAREPGWLDPGRLETIPDDEPVLLVPEDADPFRVRAGRLKPVVRALLDLFEGLGSGDGSLRVSRLDAGRIAELADTARWQFRGDADLRALAERLRHAGGAAPVELPAGLRADLREYQRAGLAWLQFLRAEKLGGVLADDMGLGKTVQTLAHLLLEKEQGRLDRPALVVMPTSLVHNWREEAQRFAPDLRVLALHGPARREDFARIPAHDLVLTTYPLVWRDEEALAAHEYAFVILDEAQNVKNAASRMSATVRRFKARHRLALTGTPLENHLGELWALFDFLLPGFLGSSREFERRFRAPIEKRGDRARREILARRVRPFLLRRRKEDVAKELPPKTVIVREVELDGAQRDLYEAMRAAMQDKVLAAVAGKGLAKSHIVILDALLKLRQVCCDPRLVKLSSARAVPESAKLSALMEMLPELLDEGRRVLLFSQFTSMLALVEEALVRRGIDYARLTGDTKDRKGQIDRFQSGKVALFLISLKAGGTGLNLTAADTVIHYDPWWNPAAENQATDRAHRIGQDKPVFVYKLVVAGSIEEKILALQDRKAELAAGILGGEGAGKVSFDEEDLDALLAPLPAE